MISMRYLLPPMSTPPLVLYMSAVVSAQYLLTRPHDAASPDITPLTPIFRTSSAWTLAPSSAQGTAAAARVRRSRVRLFMVFLSGVSSSDCVHLSLEIVYNLDYCFDHNLSIYPRTSQETTVRIKVIN